MQLFALENEGRTPSYSADIKVTVCPKKFELYQSGQQKRNPSVTLRFASSLV